MENSTERLQSFIEEKPIDEQLAEMRQGKFKFGCIGINCLGWTIIIMIIAIIIYFVRH